MKSIVKRISTLLVVLSLIGFNAACNQAPAETKVIPTLTTSETAPIGELKPMDKVSKATNYVRMDMQGEGSIIIELIPTAAPITVANFQKLVGEGFYDGLTYHRAVPNFVIQGGDPDGTGMGGAKETIKGEFLTNNIFNPLKHQRGVVSMARSQDMDSASSQFFIVLDSRNGAFLNDKYAAFGRVIYGMDTVDKIAALETNNEMIINKPVMEKVYFISAEDAKANAEIEIEPTNVGTETTTTVKEEK